MRRVLALGAVFGASLAISPATAVAQLTPVPAANTKAAGVIRPNVLSVELEEVARATGSMLLENPESPAKYYGYNDDRPNLVPLPGRSNVEAHKTEPDKNTYLVLRGQKGADPNYDYGTHLPSVSLRTIFRGWCTTPAVRPVRTRSWRCAEYRRRSQPGSGRCARAAATSSRGW